MAAECLGMLTRSAYQEILEYHITVLLAHHKAKAAQNIDKKEATRLKVLCDLDSPLDVCIPRGCVIRLSPSFPV
jgi:gamma-glutamyl phosphate reductase